MRVTILPSHVTRVTFVTYLTDWTHLTASGVGFGLAQAGDLVARFPLVASLEHLDAFKAFEHVSFCAGGAGRAQTPML